MLEIGISQALRSKSLEKSGCSDLRRFAILLGTAMLPLEIAGPRLRHIKTMDDGQTLQRIDTNGLVNKTTIEHSGTS